MHFLPLLDQNAQPVKAFDEVGCQTSPPPPSERSLGSESSTQVDFLSFEDFDNLLLGLDPTATSAPPTYSDAVTQNDSSFPLGLGLGLDQNTLVSGSSLRTSAATPACVGAAVPKHPDETFARPQKIDHLLNPVPPGIYMRARPMIWDSASSAASPYETQRLVSEPHCPQSYAHLDMKSSGLPPWRRPSIAHVAFQMAPVDLGDVFGPYPKSLAPEFDAVPRHHVPRSLTYPPPPIPHPRAYLGPNAGIDSWAEHTSSKNAPPPTYAMPGTYPPSPPRTGATPSHDVPETCCSYSTARCRHPVQRQGSLVRRTSSTHHGCKGCYPSPPPSPSSSVSGCTDSAYSSPSSSPGFDLHLSLHAPSSSHSSSTLSHEGTGAAAQTMLLSMPPLTQPSVINISIALPSPCSPSHRDQDWFYHRISSFCSLLVPFVFLIPTGVYLFSTVLPSSSSSSASGPGPGSLLHHGPLIWRAVSSLLSFVLRMMKDADVKI